MGRIHGGARGLVFGGSWRQDSCPAAPPIVTYSYRARQTECCEALSRGGGEQICFAPSNPARARSSAVSRMYCGQVSAKTLRPLERACAICSIASPPDT